MAIVINGSGTVTGLAVGGLPDGTVDDGTVASGIASSKLTGALPAISGASLTGFTDAQMPAGSVLQVVQGSTTTQVDTSSTSYVDTTLTATITPSSTSSKILVIIHQNFYQPDTAQITMQIVRGSTSLGVMGYAVYSAFAIMGYASRTHVDSPSSTSATVYKVQMKTNSIAISANYDDGGGNTVSSITLMEIAG